MSLYVYGLARRGDVRIPERLRGVAEVLVRIESVASMDAIVTDFADSVLQTNRENILAHERVLDVVLEFSTPLPFRFGAVVTLEKLIEFVTLNEATLNADLKRVEGLVQMTARLMLKSLADSRISEIATGSEGPGTQFLRERQSRRHGLMEVAAWFTEAMGGLIQGTSTTIASGRPTMATVAHLVTRSDVESYRVRFDEVCGKRLDLSSLRSGPWPPYGFVSTGTTSLQNQ